MDEFGAPGRWHEVTRFGDSHHTWLNMDTGEQRITFPIPRRDPSPFPRIGLWNARRALRRLVRVSHACSFVVGILAGVLVGRL